MNSVCLFVCLFVCVFVYLLLFSISVLRDERKLFFTLAHIFQSSYMDGSNV